MEHSESKNNTRKRIKVESSYNEEGRSFVFETRLVIVQLYIYKNVHCFFLPTTSAYAFITKAFSIIELNENTFILLLLVYVCDAALSK